MPKRKNEPKPLIAFYKDGTKRNLIRKEIDEIAFEEFAYRENIVKVIVPDDVEYIRTNAFFQCVALESVELPEGLLEIEEGAFGNCENLKTINLPYTVDTIGDSALSNCSSLEEIKIPTRIAEIPEYFCCGCTSLKRVYIPDGVYAIEKGAFMGTGIETVIFPESLRYIKENAFHSAPLKKVVFANGKSNIGIVDQRAFHRTKIISEENADKDGIVWMGNVLLKAYSTPKELVVNKINCTVASGAFRNNSTTETLKISDCFAVSPFAFLDSAIKELVISGNCIAFHSFAVSSHEYELVEIFADNAGCELNAFCDLTIRNRLLFKIRKAFTAHNEIVEDSTVSQLWFFTPEKMCCSENTFNGLEAEFIYLLNMETKTPEVFLVPDNEFLKTLIQPNL